METPATGSSSHIHLKKGDLLFGEGDHSRAMYLLRSGMIRLFKRRGEGFVELDTIRPGQVIGELAFLDGNPRSASGEALMDCELIEISGATFQNTLARMPDWLKIMLKTVVGRLRTASTRIRQLESTSSAVDYNDKDGKRTYVYLGASDVLRILAATLLVASRYSVVAAPAGEGPRFKLTHLSRYANQIMGVSEAKIASVFEILKQMGIVATPDEHQARVIDMDFLEQLTTYLNEENVVEPAKRHDITPRGYLILKLIAKHIDKFPPDAETGQSKVNLAPILKEETLAQGKPPFRLEDFEEIAKLGYASPIGIKAADEIYAQVPAAGLARALRFQQFALSVQILNERRRKAA